MSAARAAPPASASMVGRYYKEQAEDAIAARDEALAEVARLIEEVAKLKRDYKEREYSGPLFVAHWGAFD